MKQIGLYGDEPEIESGSEPRHRSRSGPRSEILRIRRNLQIALARMFRDYPNWDAQKVHEHIGYTKLVRRTGKLHQVPATIAAVRKYTSDARSEDLSAITRDLKLADHWYNLGMSRVLRERKKGCRGPSDTCTRGWQRRRLGQLKENSHERR